jgi:translation initiation factor IF-2
MKPTRPEDVFRAEKERASSARNSQHARLLAEAKAAFDKLMAEGQAARKSGRPRKHPLPPLKTTSSRPPVKPAAPAAPAAVAKAPAPPPPVAVVKTAKPVKAAASAKRPVKKAAKPAKAAKAKPKTKPSKKR